MRNKPRIFTGELALTREDYEKLLTVAETAEQRILLMIGAGLGIRRYDMSRLLVRNVNFEEHSLSYNEKKKRDAIHTVSLPPKLEQELKIFFHDHKKGEYDRIFSVRDRQLCNWYYEMLQKAGISKRGIHSLRGTAVKFCQESGWTVEQTAHLINDEIATVQIHYATPSKDEMRNITQNKQII